MHIIGSRGSGGAEQFYVRLCNALYESGHPVSAINQPGSAVSNALNPALPQYPVRMRNVWDVFAMTKIRRLVTREKPAVVQTYMGRATRLARLGRADAVHITRLGGFYDVKGYRHADAWVGNTKAICDHLIRHGMKAERVFHIGNFVAPSPTTETPLSLRERFGIPADERIIFSAGRLIERKGFEDLLRALAKLPTTLDGQRWRCLIAGDGPDREHLAKVTEGHGLTEQVTWCGWVGELGTYYQAADLFICPSRWEPLGNVILEAWYHATPVVTTASEGALELVHDGIDALVAPPENPDAIANQIRSFFERAPDERSAIGDAGNRRALSTHSAEQVIAAYASLYETLLTRGPR
ncbi:MAG: glycosyltransferase [Pseudomonadota bacterium]